MITWFPTLPSLVAGPQPPKFLGLPTCERTVRETATKFCTAIKLEQILLGRPHPGPWAEIFATRMPDARPVCGITNLIAVQCASEKDRWWEGSSGVGDSSWLAPSRDAGPADDRNLARWRHQRWRWWFGRPTARGVARGWPKPPPIPSKKTIVRQKQLILFTTFSLHIKLHSGRQWRRNAMNVLWCYKSTDLTP